MHTCLQSKSTARVVLSEPSLGRGGGSTVVDGCPWVARQLDTMCTTGSRCAGQHTMMCAGHNTMDTWLHQHNNQHIHTAISSLPQNTKNTHNPYECVPFNGSRDAFQRLAPLLPIQLEDAHKGGLEFGIRWFFRLKHEIPQLPNSAHTSAPCGWCGISVCWVFSVFCLRCLGQKHMQRLWCM